MMKCFAENEDNLDVCEEIMRETKECERSYAKNINPNEWLLMNVVLKLFKIYCNRFLSL